MIITNTQLHTATPTRTPLMCLNDLEEAMHQCTHPEAYAELEEAYWEVYREVFGEEESEDILTDAELEIMQDDLFAPQDQRHLDRLSYLALTHMVEAKGWYDNTNFVAQHDDALYDVIYSTLRMENALDIIDIWS